MAVIQQHYFDDNGNMRILTKKDAINSNKKESVAVAVDPSVKQADVIDSEAPAKVIEDADAVLIEH